MPLLAMIFTYGILLFALYRVIRKAVAAGVRDARKAARNDGSWCRKA